MFRLKTKNKIQIQNLFFFICYTVGGKCSLCVHLQTNENNNNKKPCGPPQHPLSFSILQVVLMRYRICTVHVQVERISHWWQQCWSIKDSTFYPENSANSGGQLTPRQPGSEMSWRFLPCGRRGRPQRRNALFWCAGLRVSECVCVWVREKRKEGCVIVYVRGKECVCVCMQCWQAARGVQVRCSAG